MALWMNSQEDLTKATGTKEKFKKNGVYEITIKEAYLTDSTKSQAKAVTLIFEDENSYGRANFWYLKGDGTENEFSRKTLNRLAYLLKLKTENLKTETKKYKTFYGNEMERVYLPDFTDKKIGVILTVEHDMDQVNMEVKDFFDIKTKKTSDEFLNKTEAHTVAFFEEKYTNVEKTVSSQENNVSETKDEDEDEFPF